ncbi:GNAT family N-acetyltransferase [Streptomyces sp. NPDC059783]|uniref:GNAT family N-acetyltransferase n=1 Tax=Streptomyces sp. NPDC059783 TaxID=3346944 RepID=UPI003652FDC0
MAQETNGLPDEGLSLWLTDWKDSTSTLWPGRHLVASIGRSVAGQIDFFLHPDGQALKVGMLRVHPDFQRRGLASVMMDALYEAHPTAWINHGWRTPQGARWWNGYQEPAPQRNIHNRPPGEWADYFDAVDVAADKAQNAHINTSHGLDGHQDAVYRYGERLETEAALHTAAFRPATPVRMDPTAQPLYGAARLVLPPAIHDFVHDRTKDRHARAAALLEHIGHGNLPRDAHWNATRDAAFADAHHEELFNSQPSGPATHVVFTLPPVDADLLPQAHALATSIELRHRGGLAVAVTELSWRHADRPHTTHTAGFTPAVPAAIAPLSAQYASTAYQNRYDEKGFLRPAARGDTRPFADRAAQIQALAERLLRDQASRLRALRPQPAAQATIVPQQQTPQQRAPGPGRRA